MRSRALLLAIVLGAGLAPSARADFEYRRVVGTGDPVPGAPAGTTFSYVEVPELGGDYVAFYGVSWTGGDWLAGYYLWDGQTTHRLADPTMAGSLPGTTSTTSLVFSAQHYDVDETGLAAFGLEGGSAAQPYYAIIGWQNGTVFPVAINGEPLPGDSSDTFGSFGSPRVEGGRIIFGALPSSSPAAARVYEWTDGVLRELAFPPDVVLVGGGGGPMPGVDEVATLAGGPGEFSGVWRWESGSESWTPFFSVDNQFPGGAPGDTWRPNSAQQMGVTSDGVALQGRASITPGLWGLFRISEDAPELVVGPGWAEPGTGQTGMGLHAIFSSSGERIAFSAHHPDEIGFYGVYLQEADRSFHTIATPGMMLGDVQVGSTHIAAGSLDGSRLAFAVGSFTDDAIWIAELEPSLGVAEIPTAGGPALLGFGILLACCAAAVLVRRRTGQV